jgi:3',5'-cyclic AMP phosphodiesterase CpdA
LHKVLVFTDLHILPEGETLIGLDPSARFAQALSHALAHHGDASRIVITGDLAHNGAPAEYARLRTLLSRCPIPVSLMLGNHDRRAAFAAAFPSVPLTSSGHCQQLHDLKGHRLILLDTLDEDAPDRRSGWLSPGRMRWLDSALLGAGDRLITIFTHHPPMECGFPAMDRIGLRNRDALIDRLRAHGRTAQIISGHIHRSISGSAGGLPVTIFKSPCHQAPMMLSGNDVHLSIDEPGAYGILLLTPSGVIVHSQDVGLPASPPQSYAPC